LLWYVLPTDLECLIITDATVAIYQELLGFFNLRKQLMRLEREHGAFKRFSELQLHESCQEENGVTMLCNVDVLCKAISASAAKATFTIYLSKRITYTLEELRSAMTNRFVHKNGTIVELTWPRVDEEVACHDEDPTDEMIQTQMNGTAADAIHDNDYNGDLILMHDSDPLKWSMRHNAFNVEDSHSSSDHNSLYDSD
jgi:hypothetical protein